MTLTTTEELKHLASSDNANELTRRLARECLANREAQPVGKAEITKIAADLVRGDYLSKLWTEAEKSRHVDTHRLQNLLDELHDVMKVKAIAITRLLTAPTAPANANAVAWEMRYWNSGHNCWHDWERITAEQHAEMSVQHATSNDYEFRVLYDAPSAPSAPAVPPGYRFQPISEYDAMCEYVRNAPPSAAVPDSLANDIDSYDHPLLWSYNNGWNACRAAMLSHVGDTNEKVKSKCECSSIDYCENCLRAMLKGEKS